MSKKTEIELVEPAYNLVMALRPDNPEEEATREQRESLERFRQLFRRIRALETYGARGPLGVTRFSGSWAGFKEIYTIASEWDTLYFVESGSDTLRILGVVSTEEEPDVDAMASFDHAAAFGWLKCYPVPVCSSARRSGPTLWGQGAPDRFPVTSCG